MFQLIKKDKKSQKRIGLIKTRRGGIRTPVFMPIATKGAVKNLTSEEVKDLGADLILGNTYHLWLRPGLEVIKKAEGLHEFMNWPGPILTDSGGYQIFSLGARVILGSARRNLRFQPPTPTLPRQLAGRRPALEVLPAQGKSFVKISDEGVEFSDPIDGRKYFMTPEKSIEIQLALGSDIIMVLDECPAFPCSREQAEIAVKRTTDWARRCKKYSDSYFRRHPDPAVAGEGSEKDFSLRSRSVQNDKIKIEYPLLFGIVQGGIYKDLRERSARELLAIGFDGYAVGGVAVGEPRQYLKKVLGYTLPLLPEDRPRYLMGLGKPEEIVAAVGAGIDMFDCVIPTREARHGRLYIYSSTKRALGRARGEVSSPFDKLRVNLARTIKSDFYETLQITNAKFAKDFLSIDENCSCYACQNYTRAYLHHLFRVGEPLAMRLATIHNLKFYLELMEELRG